MLVTPAHVIGEVPPIRGRGLGCSFNREDARKDWMLQQLGCVDVSGVAGLDGPDRDRIRCRARDISLLLDFRYSTPSVDLGIVFSQLPASLCLPPAGHS